MIINLDDIDLEKYILDSGLELTWVEIVKNYITDRDFKFYLNKINVNFNHSDNCLNLVLNKSKYIYEIYSEKWSYDNLAHVSISGIYYKCFKFDRYMGLSLIKTKYKEFCFLRENLSIISHSIHLCDHIKSNVVSDSRIDNLV